MSHRVPNLLVRVLLPLAITTLLLLLATRAESQVEGWEKVKGDRSPSARTVSEPGALWALGLEVGYPGVFSPRLFFPLGRRMSMGVGPVLLPDLVGVGAQYRYHLILPRIESFGVAAGGGLTFYNVRDGERDASPFGVNLGGELSYTTRSRFSLAAGMGIFSTSGADAEDPVESFGVREGLSVFYIDFSLSYRL